MTQDERWTKGHEVETTHTEQDPDGPTEHGRCRGCGAEFWRNAAEDSQGRWVHGDGGWEPGPCEANAEAYQRYAGRGPITDQEREEWHRACEADLTEEERAEYRARNGR